MDDYCTDAEVLAFLREKAHERWETAMHQDLTEPGCVTSTCPSCWTPMPMDDDGRILAHPGLHGTPCDGAGRPATAVPTHA